MIAAKSKGLIAQIKPQLDALRQVAGFYIDTVLYHRALQDAGEV